MHVITPDARQAALLARFKEAGGVLDFLQVSLPGDDVPQAAHAQAICVVMQAAWEEAVAFAESLAALGHIKQEEVAGYGFAFDCARMEGRAIGLREFLGAQYALERGRCILRGRDPYLNNWFVVGEEQSKASMAKFDGSGFPPDHGLVSAFAEPPYHLRIPSEQVDALFHEMAQAYLGGLDETLEIYTWSTDWSAYFDNGREWWGTFLWSVHRPGEAHVTVIMGSATD